MKKNPSLSNRNLMEEEMNPLPHSIEKVNFNREVYPALFTYVAGRIKRQTDEEWTLAFVFRGEFDKVLTKEQLAKATKRHYAKASKGCVFIREQLTAREVLKERIRISKELTQKGYSFLNPRV
jgi:hypothetical protein